MWSVIFLFLDNSSYIFAFGLLFAAWLQTRRPHKARCMYQYATPHTTRQDSSERFLVIVKLGYFDKPSRLAGLQ